MLPVLIYTTIETPIPPLVPLLCTLKFPDVHDIVQIDTVHFLFDFPKFATSTYFGIEFRCIIGELHRPPMFDKLLSCSIVVDNFFQHFRIQKSS